MLAPSTPRSRCVVGTLALVGLAAGPLAACGGPSDEEIRADVDEICAAMIEDLGDVDAEPGFGSLAGVADEVAREFGSTAYQVEDVADTDEVRDFSSALHAVSDAYDDLERQISQREYESLAATRETGEAAVAAAIEAADAMGSTACDGISARVSYFEIAAAGADQAAAAIAPTGDYVTDVDAACARYADDSAFLLYRLNVQSILTNAGVEPSAADYVAMVELLIEVNQALDVLVGELEALPPPAGDEVMHADLVAGFEDAIAGFRQLSDGGDGEVLVASVDEVDAAAEALGVECAVWNPVG